MEENFILSTEKGFVASEFPVEEKGKCRYITICDPQWEYGSDFSINIVRSHIPKSVSLNKSNALFISFLRLFFTYVNVYIISIL